MSSRWPTILMYHSIARLSSGPHSLCVPPERFEAQMLYLKQRNLRGVSMRELRRATIAGNNRGLIGLTFDDGYEDNLRQAVPVLERLGFSATVFVVAGMLGMDDYWEHHGPRPGLKLLQADGVRELSERGMEVGAHTMTHPKLPELDPETLVREVSNSRHVLSEIVGMPVEGFCYPYGRLDRAAIRAVRESGYVYACTVRKQIEYGVYDLPRTYVGEQDHHLRFGTKLKVAPIKGALRRFEPLARAWDRFKGR